MDQSANHFCLATRNTANSIHLTATKQQHGFIDAQTAALLKQIHETLSAIPTPSPPADVPCHPSSLPRSLITNPEIAWSPITNPESSFKLTTNDLDEPASDGIERNLHNEPYSLTALQRQLGHDSFFTIVSQETVGARGPLPRCQSCQIQICRGASRIIVAKMHQGKHLWKKVRSYHNHELCLRALLNG